MDFSEAERSGFIAAFIDFWTLRSDSRTHEELSAAAGRVLGCFKDLQLNPQLNLNLSLNSTPI